jgi:hypothetical protein
MATSGKVNKKGFSIGRRTAGKVRAARYRRVLPPRLKFATDLTLLSVLRCHFLHGLELFQELAQLGERQVL